MAGITLSEAKANLDALQTAYSTLILTGSASYSVSTTGGTRSLTRRDLSELRSEMIYWDTYIKKLDRGGITVRGVTPVG